MCKDIANSGILTPYGLFFFRALGATILFWLCSLFIKHEVVSKNDKIKIIGASFVGLFVPQMTFLIAIKETSSIDTSLISTLSPIFTMFFAAYFIKEPITWKKVLGVAISFVGVVLLILNSLYHKSGEATTTIFGVFQLFLNCFSFALYLGAFKPLITKYNVITFMKWMFLFTLIISTPFCIKDGIDFFKLFADNSTKTANQNMIIGEIIYVIVFATFIAYFLIPIGQKNIRPTLVSMYSYVQPVIAVIISIYIGMDQISLLKSMATVMIFLGVAIVNRSRTRQEDKKKLKLWKK